MKLIFFGTSEFAVPALTALAGSAHTVSLVVTQPDRISGRKLLQKDSPVKQETRRLRLPLFQSDDVSSTESIERLKDLEPDLFVVVAFGQILREELLAVPKRYAINIHGSLLPLYRGAAPVNWAIMRGEKETGVTIIRMNRYMDAGQIILKKKTDIGPDDNGITMGKKLSELGASLLLDALVLIEKGKAIFTEQDETAATYAPKLKKEFGKIEWRKPAAELNNLIRGLLPWPGAFTYVNGKILKVIEAEEAEVSAQDRFEPGAVAQIIKGEGIAVKTGVNCLMIKTLQLEGKKAMSADTFLRGYRLEIDDRLGLRP